MEHLAYFLGAWFGDAHTDLNQGKNYTILSCNDSYIPLRAARDTVGTWSTPAIYTGNDAKGTPRFHAKWQDHPMQQWLFNTFGRTRINHTEYYKRTMMPIIESFSRPALLEFLAGLLDTDGHVAQGATKRYAYVKINGNPKKYTFFNEFPLLASKLGIEMSAPWEGEVKGNFVRYYTFKTNSFLDNRAYFRLKRKMDKVHAYCRLRNLEVYQPPFNESDEFVNNITDNGAI